MAEIPLTYVFVAALITALATGLGALPLYAMRQVSSRALAAGNAIAAGLMLAATFALVEEGRALSVWGTLGGVVLGLVAIWAAKHWLDRNPDLSITQATGADARRILLIMGVMTAHSAAEGIGVGVSYGTGQALGDGITLAIALHNIPEGLAIALIMVPRGVSVPKAGLWAVVSSLPQPLLAVPAFAFVLAFQPVLPVGLGLAAGAMLWMVFSELLPEPDSGLSPSQNGILVTLAFAAMLAVTQLLG
jgi:zinc transporter, ZIP family